MFYRKRNTHLPEWLWFFIILPVGLVVALLYRQKRLPQVRQLDRLKQLAQLRQPQRRYTEPDSIPLDPHSAATPYSEIPPGAPEAEVVLDAALDEDAPEDAPTYDFSAPVRLAGIPETTGADDLKIIEGIGPAIARLMNEHGITTFAQLASTPIARLRDILSGAGLAHLADPASWPEQAALSADGKWEALQQLQNTLKGGRRKNNKA